MCIAIVTTPGHSVTNEALFKGWTSNRDGGGFAYVKGGSVRIEKGFMQYNEFQRAYRNAVEAVGDSSHFLVHMRVGTSGAKTSKNTHPFPVRGGAMIHNGIMFTPAGKRAGEADDRKSDTRVFAESLHNILVLEDVKRASKDIVRAIGGGNKLCFLYDNNEYVIVGEDRGFWVDGIWYSNGSCGNYTSRHVGD
jgi:predicted glutamine amidotransferase